MPSLLLQSFSFLRPLILKSSARRLFSSFVVEADKVHIASLKASFPYVWLRDSCQCPRCVHPSTRQKLHRSSDFARRNLKPKSIKADKDGLRVLWPDEDNGVVHTSFFPSYFLKRYSNPSSLTSFHRDISPQPWTAAHFVGDEPFAYSELSEPNVLLEVYKKLLRDGLVFFRGVPVEKTSNEECELRTLASQLGALRNTFYGETWDVRNIRDSKNIAYTNLDLGFHMDLLYFQEPPRYQILHALCNRVIGGHSIFVDAFYAAERLKRISPKTFDILSKTAVPFHYINDGHHLHCSHPTIELSAKQEGEEQRLVAANYSPPFQAPLPSSTPPSFYAALAEYAELLNDSDACVTRLLEEGDAVVFDNRRVLHGRTAFQEHEGQIGARSDDGTNRWLKGCYLEEDPVLDKFRVLSSKLDPLKRH